MNGLTYQYFTTCFKHIINFETLVDLNISANWFGVEALHQVKDEFVKFKCLKVLRLGNNKLLYCSGN